MNNNITTGEPESKTITLMLQAYDSESHIIIPNANNPFHVTIYGAPEGMITPTDIMSSTGTVQFSYNGQSFPNNLLINAWIKDNTTEGYAIGMTQAYEQNKNMAYSFGTAAFDIPLIHTLPIDLKINAAIGYNTTDAISHLTGFDLDTGSVGILLPESEIARDESVIGPGPIAVKYYDSSGSTFSGHYYLAPVNFQDRDGKIIQTFPILVFAVESAYCSGPLTNSCYTGSSLSTSIHYMGIGFDFNRNSPVSGYNFSAPTSNPFLHLNDVNNGADITPGYYLRPNDPSAFTGVRLGITTIEGYKTISLESNPYVSGDFYAPLGCYSFPDLPEPNAFCSQGLLDTGIPEMLLHLPPSQWPSGIYNQQGIIDTGTRMSIKIGGESIMSYSFTLESIVANQSPAPVYAKFYDPSIDNQIFFNTGLRPLYIYDYLYDGQHGTVGFRHLD